jgi:hypothetical protein
MEYTGDGADGSNSRVKPNTGYGIVGVNVFVGDKDDAVTATVADVGGLVGGAALGRMAILGGERASNDVVELPCGVRFNIGISIDGIPRRGVIVVDVAAFVDDNDDVVVTDDEDPLNDDVDAVNGTVEVVDTVGDAAVETALVVATG